MKTPGSLTIGQCAALACCMEATAVKPGNVHRGADFEDLSFTDFVVSGIIIAPLLERASSQRVGQTVYECIAATKARVPTNTNLGIVLLLAPLATVPRSEPLETGIKRVLAAMDSEDSRQVYAAIRLAASSALGQVDEMDVAAEAPADLLQAMAAAAHRDAVARQYVEDFALVLDVVRPWLQEGVARGWPLTMSIVHTHVRLLSEYSDSLIERKCGPQYGAQVKARAAKVLDSGLPGEEEYHRELRELDFWLRSDGHRRNPGTTADLIAAGLFACFRDDLLQAPWR